MSQRRLILGIDTSCDETSAAVVADGREILSNVVSSQVEIHERFGGIVPELASRKHTEVITRIIDRSLAEAGVALGQLDAVAVTNRPGLIGALLVGVEAAKALAFTQGIPVIPVHHIEGHIYANSMAHDVPFPHLCLTVSGGHTLLVYVREGWEYELLGTTLDDAVGEAYDKVAKLLGLGFPGGPVVDRLAHENTEEPVEFTIPMARSNSYDFSFSGLKTAVRYYIQKCEGEPPVGRIAAGFQHAAVTSLVRKTSRAAKDRGVGAVTLTGGVAANRRLRHDIEAMGVELGIDTYCPPLDLCTDNGAMIAGVAHHLWDKGVFADLSLSAQASAPLT
ncbi:tRNA (adenosine(37)-N6)-threonylcarbamoyltransferase complex transferase subunit TsaD [Candidatus Poribacteria bacterium]|jgi:N6-L-threonylcarbamoyladenine synthase|nr:tRNA (adenosine(37)-N6)-threonylcarbamoyltransferase complex transferase subunit TsaD [Candidatus Poribacteria bacterium]MBT7098670.1 tRNA (adenosine(37)-N6)-threonylcarbamoyltransferase complex transferase subunit TsaD [Candidatus Poribacteria bacterium]MBT7806812.1 tRNA (adenosine(37)-N6)-threonylcarbamoyltransferase complex transferase subunit TsaD [Candidatus Poribacteria bacterium]